MSGIAILFPQPVRRGSRDHRLYFRPSMQGVGV